MLIHSKQGKVCIGLIALSVVLIVTALFLAPSGKGKALEIDAELYTNDGVRPAEETALGTALYIDGKLIAVTKDSLDARTALDSLAQSSATSWGNGEGVHSILNRVMMEKGYYKKSLFVNGEELSALLGVSDGVYTNKICNVFGDLLSIELEVQTKATAERTVSLPFETVCVNVPFLGDGETHTEVEGADGEAVETFETVTVNGVLAKTTVLSDKTVKESVNKEVWQGVSMTLASLMDYPKLELPYHGRISSDYGWRYVFGSLDFHEGVDFIGYDSNCYGDEVYASADGVVIEAKYNGGYGNRVVIDHGNGMKTVYAHLSAFLVEKGDVVACGTPVGKIGTTGRVTGPHLHFEINLNGDKPNPADYLDFSGIQILS